MKIRIKDNTLHIQLNRQEADLFAEEGYIEAHTPFISNVFSYALQSRPDESGQELSADFKDNVITVYVPERMVKEWTGTDMSAFDTWMEVDNGERLYLSLEKDLEYQDETLENQTNDYQNPLAYKRN